MATIEIAQSTLQEDSHTPTLVNNGVSGTIAFDTDSNITLLNAIGLAAGAVVHANNILELGLDVYAQSSNGGGVSIVNVNGTSVLGAPISDDRLTVNGSLLSPVSHVDLRANSGVFDLVGLKLGSSSLVGNLLGTVIFTVYALDANYQPTGVGVSVVGLEINEYAQLNFAAMASFEGIYGVRIVNPLGFEIGIDDLQVANGRVAPPPGPLITSSLDKLKIGDTALITFTFSEAPLDFDAEHVTVTGGTLGGFAVNTDPRVYTALFTPTVGIDAGVASVSVAQGAYSDATGNSGNAGLSPSIAFDTLAPLAAAIGVPVFSRDIGPSSTDLITSVATQTVSGNLSLAPATGEKVEVSFNDGASWQQASVSDASWTLEHTLSASGVLRVRVSDAAGNHSPDTVHSYVLDQSAPTVTITSNVEVANGVTPAVITFTFSETPVGFSGDSVHVGGGVLGELTATSDPKVYTATFTPTLGVANGNAVIIVTGGYTDLAGNNGSANSIPLLQIDTVAPTATAVGASFSDDSGPDGDLITYIPSQTISGTLSAAPLAGEVVQVSPRGDNNWVAADVSGATWSLAGQTLSGSHTLVVRVIDAAGNFSTPYSAAYAIDTQAPTVTISSNASGTLGPGQSATLILTLSEAGELTANNIVVTGGTLSNFSGNGSTYTATLTPAANSSAPLTVNVSGGLFTDTAGNVNLVATPMVLNVNTIVPQPEPQPEPVPQPVPTTVDGVTVITTTGVGGTTITTIPVVTSSRSDTPGSASQLADIPLFTSSSGHILLLAGVPTGVGLQAEGLPRSTTGQTALTELIARIQQVAGGDVGLMQAALDFNAGLPSDEAVTVHILKPTVGAGFNAAIPLVITGSSMPADGRQAIILDARSLPSGSSIQVDNVDFITVVGNVRLIGGAGQNQAAGDGAVQYIVLGTDDDIIHGGGGNDTVGSKGGNDQIYGDAGDDIVFGGAGQDILSGGSGSDRLNGGTGFDVAIQQGQRTDYTVTLDGAGIKLTHIASGVSDWLVDVEQVRFDTGPSLTVAHSAAEEAAAFLSQQRRGPDLTQAEGAVIQTLDGLSALQVAQLFAQVYPQQAAGKTAQLLLEGMAGAGAVRVDAQRDATFVGDAGDNTITPMPGLAWSVDGGAGIDTLVFPANLAQTHIEASATGFTLQRMTDGAMLELTNVERLTLNDTQLALDLDGHAGQAARLLGALGGVALLDNKPLVGEVIRALDAGVSAQSLAQLGLQALGAQTPGQVTQLLWSNVVGSVPTPAQLQPFVALMAHGMTGGELAVLASNLDLNAVRIDLVGLAATGIEFV